MRNASNKFLKAYLGYVGMYHRDEIFLIKRTARLLGAGDPYPSIDNTSFLNSYVCAKWPFFGGYVAKTQPQYRPRNT